MADKKPPRRESERPYASYQPKQVRRDYEHFAPGAGYTPPYKKPEPTPTPPKNLFQRSRQFWRSYRGMGQRARADSMVWWLYKFIQGIMFGGSLLVMGVLIVIFSTVMGHIFCLDGGGIAAIIGGIVLLIYFAAAPFTHKWIVFVPENHYWVVEDHAGHTLEFLGPGRMHVAWQRGCKVRDYVNFRWLNLKIRLDSALQVGATKIGLEVDLMMEFDPVSADPAEYARLRSLDSLQKFEALLTHDVQRILRYHLNRMPTPQQQHMAHNANLIEDLLSREMEPLDTLGLMLASSRPVSVYVQGILPRIEAQPPVMPFMGKAFEEPTQPKAPTPLPKVSEPPDTIQHPAAPPTREHSPDVTHPAVSLTEKPASDVTQPVDHPGSAADDTMISDTTPPNLKTTDDLIDPLSLRRRSRRTPPPKS
ncbi:MAG: hypothetical protein HY866_18460 [Chloroflexi bacterium]|nr:hypothetical protein [Chloroflexota bacterium]